MFDLEERRGRAAPKLLTALLASAFLTTGASVGAVEEVEPGNGETELPGICEEHLGGLESVDLLVVGPPGLFIEPQSQFNEIQEAIDEYAASEADGACIFVHQSDERIRHGYQGFLINTQDLDKAGNVVIFGPFANQPGLRVDLDNRTGDFFDDGEAVIEGTGTISNDDELDNVVIAGLTFVSADADAINGVRLTSGVIENNILRGDGESLAPENAGIATASSAGAASASWTLRGNNIAGFERGLDLDGGADSVDVQIGGVPQLNQIVDNQTGIRTREALHGFDNGNPGIQIGTNLVQNNEQGIHLEGGQVELSGNLIFGNEGVGIRAGVSGGSLDDLDISGNFILGNGTGLEFDQVPATSDGLLVHENIIAGNDTGLESAFLLDARFNIWWLGDDPLEIFAGDGAGFSPGTEPGGQGQDNLGPQDLTDLTAMANPNYNNVTGLGDSVTGNVRYWPWHAATADALDDNNASSNGNGNGDGLVETFPLTELVPVTPVPLSNVTTDEPDTLYSFAGGPLLVFDFGLEGGAEFDTVEAFQQQFDADGNESTSLDLTPLQETDGFSIQDVVLTDELKSEVRAEAQLACSVSAIILTGQFTSFVQHDPVAPPAVDCGDFIDFDLNVNHRRYRNQLRVDEVKLDGDPITGTGCKDEIINQLDTCEVGPIESDDVIIEFVIKNDP